MTLQSDIAKASLSAAVSVGGWIASTIEQVPAWIREFGLPLVMLAGAVAAVVYLYKEIKAERAARIADRDRFIEIIRADADKGEASRASLLNATHEQTNEFRRLREHLERK